MSAVRNRGKFYTLLALFILYLLIFFMVFFCFSNRDDLLQTYSKALYPFLFLIIEDRRPENRVVDTGSISQQDDK